MLKQKIEEIIRVNHAGEMGAKVIYQGQMAAFRIKQDKDSLKLVDHMLKQEEVHFDYFDDKIKQHQIRPTLMQPIWKFAGFALGFTTAMIDKKAAMACTTAVEEVIDEHYQGQMKFMDEELDYLEAEEKVEMKELKGKISQFRDEELEHRDIGYKHDAAKFKGFFPLNIFIKTASKLAIAISKKV